MSWLCSSKVSDAAIVFLQGSSFIGSDPQSQSWHKKSSVWAEFSCRASEGPLGVSCPVCVLAGGRFPLLIHSLALKARMTFSSLRYARLPVAIHSNSLQRSDLSRWKNQAFQETSAICLLKKMVFPSSDIVVFPVSSNESVFGRITSAEEREGMWYSNSSQEIYEEGRSCRVDAGRKRLRHRMQLKKQ